MDNELDHKLLSDAEFAALTGTSEVTVRDAVSDGRLLAVRRINPDGSDESGVAGFQAMPEIQGAPLYRVLSGLGYPNGGRRGSMDAAGAYLFFLGRHELLGDLTPVEVLIGAPSARSTHEGVLELLSRSHTERVEFAAQVARSTVEKLQSW
jgi:hypothetical protein